LKLDKALNRERNQNKHISKHLHGGKNKPSINKVGKENDLLIKQKRNVKQLAQEASINDSLNL
jgi:hypothetical protein